MDIDMGGVSYLENQKPQQSMENKANPQCYNCTVHCACILIFHADLSQIIVTVSQVQRRPELGYQMASNSMPCAILSFQGQH